MFSDEELEALRSFPAIGREELIRYFTLTPADEAFLRKFLRPQTVLGAAVQLCTLPWLGFRGGVTREDQAARRARRAGQAVGRSPCLVGRDPASACRRRHPGRGGGDAAAREDRHVAADRRKLG
ncbi:DUF4158 domain-containing protein [Streptomyces sp. NPDC052013]|uniref:DUF4158 domain-containing protein n=1 Tax=Streptomyces sp. NPDC052013 TaxID=3365679 RepID=UPI0037D7FC17